MDAFLIDGLQPKTVSALSQTAREARLQTRRFLIERLYSLVDQFSEKDHCNTDAAEACLRRWDRLVAAAAETTSPETEVPSAEVRDRMMEAVGHLAAVHADEGRLPLAICWLHHMRSTQRSTPGTRADHRVLQAAAFVVPALLRSIDTKGREVNTRYLLQDIQSDLDETENDWNVPYRLEQFLKLSQQFAEALVECDHHSEALIWLSYVIPLVEFVPEERFEMRGLIGDFARSLRDISRCLTKADQIVDALDVAQKGIAWCERYRECVSQDDIRDYHEQLLGQAAELATNLAAQAWNPSDVEPAFRRWLQAWDFIAALHRLGEETSSPDSDLTRGIRRCMVPESALLQDAAVRSALTDLRHRLNDASTSTERDFLRFASTRLRIYLVDWYESEAARAHNDVARVILNEIVEIEESGRRDTELIHFVETLSHNCRDESLFRDVFEHVQGVPEQFNLLVSRFQNLTSDGEFEAAEPLLTEALAIWEELPEDQSRLRELNNLADSIGSAIDKAVEEVQLEWAVNQLPWFDRLNTVRATTTKQLDDLSDDDRSYGYSRQNSLSVASLATAAIKSRNDVLSRRMQDAFIATLRCSNQEQECVITAEIAFSGWRQIAQAYESVRRFGDGLLAALRMWRLLLNHSDEGWCGGAWYELTDVLTSLACGLCDRGPVGRARARELIDWIATLLPNISDEEWRDERRTWLANLHRERRDIPEALRILNAIGTPRLKVYSAAILAGCQAAGGDVGFADATVAKASQLADELDPDCEVRWLRATLTFGEALIAAEVARVDVNAALDRAKLINNSLEQVQAQALIGRACALSGQLDAARRVFLQSTALLAQSSDDDERKLAESIVSVELLIAVVARCEQHDRDSAAALLELIPIVHVRDEAEWLTATIPEQQHLAAMQTRCVNPLPLLAAADRTKVPDKEVLMLLSDDVTASLAGGGAGTGDTPDSELTVDQLADLWERVDATAIRTFLGLVAEVESTE